MKQIILFFTTLCFLLPFSMEAQTDQFTEFEAAVNKRIEKHKKSIDKQKTKMKKRKALMKDHQHNHRDHTMTTCPDDAFLGVVSNSISKEKAQKLGFDNPHGSYVAKVIGNTAADKAGLKPFDYIVGINEHRMSSEEGLTDILDEFEPGDQVTVHFVRQGKKQATSVALGTREDAVYENENSKKAFLGIRHEGGKHDETGVRIGVVNNSTAEGMGLQDGDVITAINGNLIIDWDDISTSIDNMNPGEEISVCFNRDGQKFTNKQTIKSYASTNHYNEEKKQKEDKVQEELVENYAFLGVYTDEISKEKARKLGFDNPYGSYVTGIIPGTAAEKGGMKQMDYIYGIDEYRVGEHQKLTTILRKYQPNQKAAVHLVRKGKKTSANVTFGSRTDKRDKVEKVKKNKCQDAFFGITSSGDAEKGVRVNVVKNSTAKELGLQNGDELLTINDHPLADWNDISMAIDQLNPGESIAVSFHRNGQTMKASSPIKSYAEAKGCEDCDCNDKFDYSYTNKWEHEIHVKPEMNFHMNEDHNISHDHRIAAMGGSRERMDLSSVTVVIGEMSANDVNNLRNKGHDIPKSSNLNINDFNLSANPSKGLFDLEFDLPNSGTTIVRVFNAGGRVIYEYELGEFTGEFEDKIDMAQNGAGAYFLQVKQGNKASTKKIVLTTG